MAQRFFYSLLMALVVAAGSPAATLAVGDARAMTDAGLPESPPSVVQAVATDSVAQNDPAQTVDEQSAELVVEGLEEARSPVEAAESESAGGLPQLEISTYASQIFWLLLTFGVLYLFFAKKTLPALGSVIESREGKIKGDLAEAERLRAQAQNIRESYEAGLEKSRAGAMEAVQEVEQQAKKATAEQAEEFRKKSEVEIASAERRMDDVRAKSMEDMTVIAAEVAAVAAEKITGVNTDVQKAKDIVQSLSQKPEAA